MTHQRSEGPEAAGAPPLLFTPGPLTTSPTVKAAMLRDLGSRDRSFLAVVAAVRAELLRLAEADEPEYTALPLQGSGTYAVEATLGSVIPDGGRLLVLSNGAYGERIAAIAQALRIPHHVLSFPEDQPVDPAALEQAPPGTRHVAVVHCETSTGLLNPVGAVAAAARARGLSVIVDAMSSFGALPTPIARWGVDALVTSANKCLEGVPGFALVLLRRDALARAQAAPAGSVERPRSFSLDLAAQLRGLDRDGQFRFTPPTHALLALHQALHELGAEGGVAGRGARYQRNHEALHEGARALGLRPFLPPERQSPLISSFYMPEAPRFDFRRFYEALASRGFVIYPGKVSRAACFRIGTIGHLEESDVRALVQAMAEVLTELGVPLPLPPPAPEAAQ